MRTDSWDTGLEIANTAEWIGGQTELKPPLLFERVGNGQSNLTYRVQDASGRVAVLRRPPLGAVLESAHDMEREYQILLGLGLAGVPVPRVIALCTDPDVTGAKFYLMDYVGGPILATEADALALGFGARRRAGLDMGAALARLQEVDLPAVGLGHLVRNTPLAARQLRRWRSQWHASKTRALPLVDELADRLEAAMPPEHRRVLVHGDYRLDNLILRQDGSVASILDWELCTTGHPLADLGLAMAYWYEAQYVDGLFGQAVTSLPGFVAPEEVVRNYAEASGEPVDNVGYFTAFAYWKIAIIAEGVHRRWLTNPANGSKTVSRVGAAVPRLVARADEEARLLGF